MDLSSRGVGVRSPPPNDTDIVIAGDPLSFQLNRSITRQVVVVAMCGSEPVKVSRQIENIESGTQFKRRSFAFTTPPPSLVCSTSTNRNGPSSL
jgi:hypothetical protein